MLTDLHPLKVPDLMADFVKEINLMHQAKLRLQLILAWCIFTLLRMETDAPHGF